MDDYLKMMGGNVETFAAQLAPAAEKKVKVDLILDRIAKENNFEATDEELSQRMEEVAKMAYRCEHLKKDIEEAPQVLQDKHFFRKHGENAYYGQGV